MRDGGRVAGLVLRGERRAPASRTTVYFRVFASGRLPPIAEAASYELCVDLKAGGLVAVKPVDAAQTDETLPNVLRGLRWAVVSSLPFKGGVRCWRQRFVPGVDDGGKPAARADSAPTALIDLDAPGSPVVNGTPEDDHYVGVTDDFVSNGVRYVMLTPRFGSRLQLPALEMRPPAPTDLRREDRLSGDTPHLPDLVKIRFKGTSRLDAFYSVCIGTDGRVQWLVPEVPIDGANHAAVHVLKSWIFRARPEPTCSMLHFQYRID
jgi:hypothetical protein